VLLGERAPLHAEVALRYDVVPIAADREHAAVLDVDLDAAQSVTEAAERPVGLDHRPAAAS
jgi:hypothetical protein